MTFKEFIAEQCPDMTGIADTKNITAKDVDQTQLDMGVKVEMEHTKDKEVAKKIATDHLAEDPEYYTKLQKAGL